MKIYTYKLVLNDGANDVEFSGSIGENDNVWEALDMLRTELCDIMNKLTEAE